MASDLEYYSSDAFEPKQYLNTYFRADMDKGFYKGIIVKPLEMITKALASENICGDTLISTSLGPIVYQLFPAWNKFKKIYILDTNSKSINEIKKWISKSPDAHDWTFAAKEAASMGDKSANYQDIEDTVRSMVQYTGKCDFSQENPASPAKLPGADCLFCLWILDSVSKDRNAFKQNLKHFLSLLKPGGHIVMFGDMNISFHVTGKKKFFALPYDKAFLTEAINEAGCVIKIKEEIAQQESSLYDATKTMFVVAQKK